MKKDRVDILNRDKFVDDIFTVIETLSANKKSCTFAINGEWGSGKSFVLDMLEEKLSSWQNEETADDKYIVFHYNCWQYDFYNEPLVAIVSALYDEAEKQCNLFSPETNQKFKDAWMRTKSSVGYIAGGVTQKLFGVNTRDMHREVQKDIAASHDNKEYDENYSFQTVIFDAREKISKLSKDHTVIVVVDELDRCLPEYAIKVLERLHHLFDDIKNLIVVLAVDKNHLNNTVSQIFGFNKPNSTKDIDSYLAKFIDFEIKLDKGTVNDSFREKYSEYVSLFIDNNSNVNVNEYVSLLLDNVDNRSREKIIEKALLIHSIVFDKPVNISVMCAELLCLVCYKYKKQNGTWSGEQVLPSGIKENKRDFYDYFDKNIVKRTPFTQSDGWRDKNTTYYIQTKSDDVRALILSLSSFSTMFRFRFRIPIVNENLNYLEEGMKRFDELCDIIN